VKSKLEASEVARDHLKSKGLEAAKEYQAFRRIMQNRRTLDLAREKMMRLKSVGGTALRARRGSRCSLLIGELDIGRKSSSSHILS
jgi:hypothetical protein